MRLVSSCAPRRLCGHHVELAVDGGRNQLLITLGWESDLILRIEDLTEAQVKAYVIADNKLAELAGWDEEILAKELQFLTELDLDFDIEVTGFEMGEIDVLFESQGKTQPDRADDIPKIDEDRTPVSSLGDVWLLGPHRLACGDALSDESYRLLMGERRAQMVFVDPPYNVSIEDVLTANGKVKHPEFVMASGEMSSEKFTEFLSRALGHHAAYSRPGSIHFVCMDWRHMGEVLQAGEVVYSGLKNLCIWKKTNAGMGSLYRSQHELVFVFQHGHSPSINNVQLGAYGRNRTNVWEYAGQNVVTSERLEALAMHPTVKPVRLVADAVLDCSKRGGLILDGFAGSGTAVIAAEQTGRIACALELDPRYVDVAILRWEKLTGEPARHEATGLTFAEATRLRAASGFSSDDPTMSAQNGGLVDG
jgi:16S rRNA G966 N2-methylase RsmD